MARIKKKMLYGVGLLAVAAPLIMLSGCNMGQYAEPAYTASESHDGIEIRDYKPVIAAEVSVTGERKEAISQGFRMIADYIFGNNLPKEKIAMTTPVIQQADEGKKSGEKIAMTTPVIQQADGKSWKVQFIMPAEYTLATLPKPVNDAVKLREIPGKRMVVIRFSGSTVDEKMAQKTTELQAYVKQQKLHTVGEPVLAFYDPPWTLPFFRRNEVMLELAPEAKKH